MLEKEFKKIGFSSEEINKIRYTYPINQLTDETLIEKLNSLYDYLILFGYRKHEIRKIISQCPSILGYDIEKLNNKFNNDLKK